MKGGLRSTMEQMTAEKLILQTIRKFRNSVPQMSEKDYQKAVTVVKMIAGPESEIEDKFRNHCSTAQSAVEAGLFLACMLKPDEAKGAMGLLANHDSMAHYLSILSAFALGYLLGEKEGILRDVSNGL